MNKIKNNSHGRLKNSAGFTLIEMLVVIAIVIFIVPVMFSVVFSVLREQTKIYRLSTVKGEGDYVLNRVSSTVRNYAISIHSASPPDDNNQKCKAVETYSSSSSLYFQDEWGEWFSFYLSSGTISSSSSQLAQPQSLNSDKTAIYDFSIGCTRAASYSPPTISLSFNICYVTSAGSCASTRPEEFSDLHFQTKIKLRNY